MVNSIWHIGAELRATPRLRMPLVDRPGFRDRARAQHKQAQRQTSREEQDIKDYKATRIAATRDLQHEQQRRNREQIEVVFPGGALHMADAHTPGDEHNDVTDEAAAARAEIAELEVFERQLGLSRNEAGQSETALGGSR